MPQFAGSINSYPGRASLTWYAALILTGFAALYLAPACASDPARPIGMVDALFTSTSASCVTGLVVRSTVNDFSPLGQAVILLLIQLGGIGIMTVTTFIVVQFSRGSGIRQRKAIAETLGAGEQGDLRRILRSVLSMTLAFEAAGFGLLLAYNQWNFERFVESGVWVSRGEAAWHALFHSVSAFCNAGFALHDQSLTPFADSWVVNLTIGALVIVGGLGFPVVIDLWNCRKRRRGDRWSGLQLHTKVMMIGTGLLLAIGLVSFFVLEADGVLSGKSLSQRLLRAMFHTITCRTAGFNTVEVADMTSATLFISLLLMMIGTGPCSTGGGIKVTTAAILGMRAWATFQGYSRINVFRRTLSSSSVERAVATALLFMVVAAMAVTVLLVVEQSTSDRRGAGLFLETLFEVISALGTVGLSAGLTSELSDPSRLIVVLLMIMGRLGPITAFIALSHSERTEPVEYPNDSPLVG